MGMFVIHYPCVKLTSIHPIVYTCTYLWCVQCRKLLLHAHRLSVISMHWRCTNYIYIHSYTSEDLFGSQKSKLTLGWAPYSHNLDVLLVTLQLTFLDRESQRQTQDIHHWAIPSSQTGGWWLDLFLVHVWHVRFFFLHLFLVCLELHERVDINLPLHSEADILLGARNEMRNSHPQPQRLTTELSL